MKKLFLLFLGRVCRLRSFVFSHLLCVFYLCSARLSYSLSWAGGDVGYYVGKWATSWVTRSRPSLNLGQHLRGQRCVHKSEAWVLVSQRHAKPIMNPPIPPNIIPIHSTRSWSCSVGGAGTARKTTIAPIIMPANTAKARAIGFARMVI